MDLSRLDRNRTLAGIAASALLVISILFLPWFTLTDVPEREVQNAWICGTGDHSCTAWETFPILRWLMLLLALAPAILGYILVRGHKLSYPPGEITMLAGFAGVVLIAYNGILFKPEPDDGIAFGTGLSIGYFVALVAALTIGMIGFMRSMDSGGKQQRKAPGTV
ncbi:MAG: hypothetical protein M3383_08450 [Actinomycetota bacterium]|nr:hypothetical protein [Actinomycetota bacterium]